jgi:CheY-like chemotaxis protein
MLIVDDRRARVDLIRCALEDPCLKAQGAGSGAKCLPAVTEERPDLVILGVVMPIIIGGFQALQAPRQSLHG